MGRTSQNPIENSAILAADRFSPEFGTIRIGAGGTLIQDERLISKLDIGIEALL